MIKRILCLAFTVLLLAPAVLADEGKMVFHLEGASGSVGDTVTIVGSIKNAPAIASFRVIMSYDTAVLEPVSGKKLDCSGMFLINTNATYEGKNAVNALSADAELVAEGDVNLFSVTFKIIGTPTDEKGSLIQVEHYEFVQQDLSGLNPTIEPCRIQVTTQGTATSPDETAPNNGAGASESPATATDQTKEDTPTGSWVFDDSTVIHMEENGDATIYQGKYVKDKDDKVTGVDLYDENNQKTGSLTVEEKDDQTLEVTRQDLTSDTADSTQKIPYRWILGSAALIVALIGLVAAILIKRKHASAPNKPEETGNDDE